MATSVNIGGKVYTYYKGAVEKLLDKCTNVTPEHLALDGQQRLTSIYRSTVSKDPVDTKTDKGKEIQRS